MRTRYTINGRQLTATEARQQGCLSTWRTLRERDKANQRIIAALELRDLAAACRLKFALAGDEWAFLDGPEAA